ncbi:MAG: hypothetical protein IT440_04110, partial [Phycisphaeraceae bacterium]|nr:hypothetical protein [Phycisphaeraceae bacterium]
VLVALAGALCFYTFTVHRKARIVGLPIASPRLWLMLAVMHLLFFLEIQFELRYVVSNAMRDMLKSEDLYNNRRAIQAGFLLLATVPVFALCGWLCYRFRRAGAHVVLGLIGTLICAMVFAMEMVSTHSFDQIMYHHMVGPFMLVAMLWAAGAVVADGAAVVSARWAMQYIPRPRRR